MKIPSQLVAGDSYTWKDDATTDNLGNAISAPDWTLKYAFRQSAVTLSLTATADGSGWSTVISKAQSATFAAGVVFWQAYVEKDTQRVTLGTGQLTITKNIADAPGGAFDGRSQAEQDLEAVETAIRALISGGVKSYTIGNRALTKHDMADLILWRDRLKAEVVREQKAQAIANGLGNPNNLFVRFK